MRILNVTSTKAPQGYRVAELRGMNHQIRAATYPRLEYKMYQRTDKEFKLAFLYQYKALRASASNFDTGQLWESFRIANAIFILIGKKMRNHTPLIERIGRAEGLTIPSSRTGSEAFVQVKCMVLSNTDGNSAVYAIEVQPCLDLVSRGNLIPLEDWWGQLAIETERCNMTRYTLIRIIRDKDGGAHVDEYIEDQNYENAISQPIMFYQVTPYGQVRTPFLLESHVRQIAEEVLVGLLAVARSAEYEIELENSNISNS